MVSNATLHWEKPLPKILTMVTTYEDSINKGAQATSAVVLFAGAPDVAVEQVNTRFENIYTICSVCLSWSIIGPHKVKSIVYISGCKKCITRWSTQSEEFTTQSGTEDATVREISDGISQNIDNMSSDDIYSHIIRSLPQRDTSTTMAEVTDMDVSNLLPTFTTPLVHNDIKKVKNSLSKWLFDREYKNKSFIGSYITLPPQLEIYIDLIEDTTMLLHSMLHATTHVSRYMAIVSFCKLRGSRIHTVTMLFTVFCDVIFDKIKDQSKQNEYWNKLTKEVQEKLGTETLDKFQTQAEEANPFQQLREYTNNWFKLKETTIVKKLHKFGLYILTAGILDKMNITFKSCNYSKYEADCIKRTHRPGLGMIETFVDTILFVCERGYSYFQTGDVATIFHSGSSYESWVTKAQKLIRDANFLNNPEPHGINKFQYINDLKDAIEKGKGIIKFTAQLEKTEKMLLQKLLNDLQLIESQELTRREAQKPRKDPFAVLVHGSSSICKSQLKQILFYHYAKCFNLPSSPEYMYTRCPADEFWSGFNSTQWCIVMDDIAFLKPNGEVDPTLLELLQVKNSVPYVPPQADLADKGRTPIRSELLIGTTNTKHLNLNAYFACPFAVARRLSYVITAKVKPEFSRNVIMADSTKIPITPDGEYMNIWNFEVAIPLPNSDEDVDNQQTRYKVLHTFDDINDMLVWYIECAKAHEVSQTKATNADTTMSSVSVCNKCYRATKCCTCTEFAQQDDDDDSTSVYSSEYDSEMYFTSDTAGSESGYERMGSIDPDNMDMGIGPHEDPAIHLREVSKIKLYCYSQIIQHSVFMNPIEAYIYDSYIKSPKRYQLLSLLAYWYCPWTTIFSFIFIGLMFISKYMWVLAAYYYQWHYGSFWKLRLATKLFATDWDAYKYIFRLAGNRIEQSTQMRMPHLALMIASCSVATVALLKIMYHTGFIFMSSSEGIKPPPREEEKPSFYYHDPYKITEMDISSQSKCAQPSVVDNIISANLARFYFMWDLRPGKTTCTTALNIRGNIWLFNKHAIKGNNAKLSIVRDPVNQNVSRNVWDINISLKDIATLEHSDLAVIQLTSVPPGKSLYEYFPLKDQIQGTHKGMYHMISKHGVQSKMDVNALSVHSCPLMGYKAYLGTAVMDTKEGDCGSPMVVKIGTTYTILGIHTTAHKKKVCPHHVSQHMLNKLLEKFGCLISQGTIKIDAPGYPRELVDVHPKAAVRFVESGTINVMGSFAGYRPKPKSKVTKTHICDAVRDEYPLEYGPPSMTWHPWSLAIRDMVKPTFSFDNSIVRACSLSFLIDIRAGMKDEFADIQVYDLETALNGADGVTYVDKINTNTSAGLPFRCSKKKFIEFDEFGKIDKVDKIILDRVDDILNTYQKRERYHPTFCNHLKDDPTPVKKIAAHKTRVFSGGDFAWSIVVRRFFLSHVRMIQNNPFVFEAMPGIVAQSEQWHELYNYLTQFGDNTIIAGDYGKFDRKMAAPFILAAFDILINIAATAGWKEDDLAVLQCIAYDTAYPTMDFNGDLIEVQGNPSGHPLTVIINCLVNSLYMRYAYVKVTGKSARHFKEDVKLATYGDDNVMCVRQGVDKFNHTSISAALADIGVEYTMADKESHSRPYISINEVSFLKRIFRWDDEMKSYMAVLEEASINKMLTSYVANGILCPEAHSICAIETALREYFFYGRDMFNNRSIYLRNVVEKTNLIDWIRPSTFPNYDTMAIDFWKRHITPQNRVVAEERIDYFTAQLGLSEPKTPMCDGLTSPTH